MVIAQLKATQITSVSGALPSINNLFEHLGTVHILKNEKLLNSVTAISGSGPAYVFLFLLVQIFIFK